MSNGVTQDSVTTASGLLKTVFGDYVDVLPEQEVVVKKTSQIKGVKIGSQFQEAVNLEFGHSVTAIGNKDQTTTLEPPTHTPVLNAAVDSYVFDYREVLTETIIQRAKEGEQAFKSATSVSMERAQKSMTRILEELYMFGTSQIAQFTGVTASLTNNQVTLDFQEFAPSISIGTRNMKIDIWNKTTGIKILTTTVSSVDFANRVWTLDSVTGLANGVVYTIYRKGFKGLSPTGLYDILFSQNSLYGIPESYELWAPNVYDAANTSLNYKSIVTAVQRYKAKGLAKDLFGICGENSYLDLLPDYNSLNQTTASPGPRPSVVFSDRNGNLQFGTDEIKFKVNSLSLEICASSYQKEGLFFAVDFDSIVRIGSTDKPFIMKAMPGQLGGKDESYLRYIPNSTLYEFQLWSDTALFTAERNRHFAINNILPGQPV